jgi:hypothetical protein
LTGSQYYNLTLDNGLGTTEIVKVTARTGTTLTVVRAQSGTTAAAWAAGTVVDLRNDKDSYSPSTIIDAQSLTTVTPASGDKILLQDVSDSDNLKVALFSSFGGGGGTFFPYTTQNNSFPTLTVSSNYLQHYTGSGGGSLTMPVASTLTNGQSWRLVNRQSSGNMSVFTSGGNSIATVAFGMYLDITCIDTAGGTGTASWAWALGQNSLTATGTGSVYVRQTSPQLITPDLGTPTSLTLTNATNLQLSGLAGFSTSGNFLVSNGSAWTSVARKPPVQTVFTTTGTMATGTTTMPLDNTTPQNTEGDEYMTLAITPTNSSNILEIEICAFIGNSVAEGSGYALFQDSTANCLKSGIMGALAINPVVLKHRMTAGTTSATTFRFRAGRSSSGTITFNGFASTAAMNGTLASYIKITEYQA